MIVLLMMGMSDHEKVILENLMANVIFSFFLLEEVLFIVSELILFCAR